jgi:uncharacterized membrane protein
VKLSTSGGTRRYLFGDLALLAFLLAQALDGVLTYVGVNTYGPRIEGNPIVGWLMGTFGEGLGLATAKVTAGGFGILLHLSGVHMAVALLTVFYVAVAIIPWVAILFVF